MRVDSLSGCDERLDQEVYQFSLRDEYLFSICLFHVSQKQIHERRETGESSFW